MTFPFRPGVPEAPATASPSPPAVDHSMPPPEPEIPPPAVEPPAEAAAEAPARTDYPLEYDLRLCKVCNQQAYHVKGICVNRQCVAGLHLRLNLKAPFLRRP